MCDLAQPENFMFGSDTSSRGKEPNTRPAKLFMGLFSRHMYLRVDTREQHQNDSRVVLHLTSTLCPCGLYIAKEAALYLNTTP